MPKPDQFEPIAVSQKTLIVRDLLRQGLGRLTLVFGEEVIANVSPSGRPALGIIHLRLVWVNKATADRVIIFRLQEFLLQAGVCATSQTIQHAQ